MERKERGGEKEERRTPLRVVLVPSNRPGPMSSCGTACLGVEFL